MKLSKTRHVFPYAYEMSAEKPYTWRASVQQYPNHGHLIGTLRQAPGSACKFEFGSVRAMPRPDSVSRAWGPGSVRFQHPGAGPGAGSAPDSCAGRRLGVFLMIPTPLAFHSVANTNGHIHRRGRSRSQSGIIQLSTKTAHHFNNKTQYLGNYKHFRGLSA